MHDGKSALRLLSVVEIVTPMATAWRDSRDGWASRYSFSAGAWFVPNNLGLGTGIVRCRIEMRRSPDPFDPLKVDRAGADDTTTSGVYIDRFNDSPFALFPLIIFSAARIRSTTF